jgi:hypothetical protein
MTHDVCWTAAGPSRFARFFAALELHMVSHVTGCCLVPNKESSASNRKHKLRLNGYITPNFAANNRATLKDLRLYPGAPAHPLIPRFYTPCQHSTHTVAQTGLPCKRCLPPFTALTPPPHANPRRALGNAALFSHSYTHTSLTPVHNIFTTLQKAPLSQKQNRLMPAGRQGVRKLD